MKSEQELEKLIKRKKEIDSRIINLKAKVDKTKRKEDTRKKILVGAYFIQRFEKEEKLTELNTLMDGFLTRKIDRVLFGLTVEDNNTSN